MGNIKENQVEMFSLDCMVFAILDSTWYLKFDILYWFKWTSKPS